MTKREKPATEETRKNAESAVSTAHGKTPWVEPKLQFVEPTLTKQGEMKDITAGFIGTFIPED